MHSVLSPLGSAASHHSHFSSLEDDRASVSNLLTRASSYPCSAATPAFARLAHQTSTFQLALDALLPILDPPTPAELSSRILVSFILFSLYSPHPIGMNPFKSVLFITFVKERELALTVANSSGGIAPNEPLVWVLWKILKGDGEDIGPYSPSALSRSLLPPNFRAKKLILDDSLYHKFHDLDDDLVSPDPIIQYEAITATERVVSADEDTYAEAIAHALRLLLAARSRVLSLSEQRHLAPLFPALAAAAPRLLVPNADLTPLIATNPELAAGLISAILANGDPVESRHSGLTTASILSELASLPPMLPSFDVMGRLLRDETVTQASVLPSRSEESLTVGALIRMEVLGRFLAGCMEWIDRGDREQREGSISDDRVAQATGHLCRFYSALLKRGLVSAGDDADSAAMAHFSLKYARYEEACAIYAILVRNGPGSP
ncbi:unnamed protein product [Mycena citricolor]|uniref:CCR4-NOT transcription complex subunit 11 n=1 Tax=Mycena citricolor TaxID=2018698 RepID=A0AAD2GQT9_9AGAR|nr:unnamed protein product [Mycena citricolor]